MLGLKGPGNLSTMVLTCTTCCNISSILQFAHAVYLNVNQALFVMETVSVYCEVGTEIYTLFR